MKKKNAGVVYLIDGSDPVGIPEFNDYIIEPNGWLTVEKEGKSLHYPPNQVDHIEMDSR